MPHSPTYEELDQKIRTLKKTLAGRRSLENGLLKCAEGYKAIFECVLDCIFIVNFEGQIINANNAALNLLGYKRDEMLSLNFHSLICQDQIPLAIETLEEINRTGYQKGFTELKFHDKYGKNVIVETKASAIFQDSEPWAILVIARDITKRRQTGELLVQKITELNTFINTIPDMAWLKDADSCFIDVNKAFCEAAGMEPEELINHTCEVCFGAEAAKKFKDDDQNVMEGKEKVIIEEKIIDSQNNEIWLETIKSPIFDESGKPTGTIGISRDITKRKQMEDALSDACERMEQRVRERTVELNVVNEQLRQEIEERKKTEHALRESKERYTLATHAAKVGVWDFNLQTNEFYLDPNVKAILGYSDNEIPNDISVWTTYIHQDDLQPVMRAFQDHIDGHTPEYVYEHRMWHKDGSIRWILVRGTAIRDDQGNPVRVVGTDTDITERKQAEEQIAASLKEKEVLLREIHHRVKNNMQSITSLLRLHSRRSSDARLRRIFDDCRDRINAMSLIHETLYQSQDLARIDIEKYLKKLCQSLSRAHGASGNGVVLTVERCNVALNTDQGIALGMVICELIANAFHHAFPCSKGGTVSINLSGIEGEQVELVVSDDGKGLPTEIDINNSKSLGLQLVVATVTRELNGSIRVERNGGTRFIIRLNCMGS